jgi:2-keto-3-deoxy-L-rhamnonate aldolase RhmA
VQKVIDEAITQIVNAGRTAGTLVNDENVERYLDLGVRFVMTGWPIWVVKGATAFLTQVAGKPTAAPR